MRTIGIVGGVGPYAGLDLANKLLAGTKASCDQEHLPFILASLPHKICDRMQFLLHGGTNPGHALGEIMLNLVNSGAEVLGMPCNTAHSPRILEVAVANLPSQIIFVHMISEVMVKIKREWPHIQKVGVLCTVGTYATGLYQDALQAQNLQAVFLPEEGRKQVQEAISNPKFGIKACSPVSDQAKMILHQASEELIEQGAEIIILGCTELPLALSGEILGTPLLDTTAVLVEALRRECLA